MTVLELARRADLLSRFLASIAISRSVLERNHAQGNHRRYSPQVSRSPLLPRIVRRAYYRYTNHQ